MTTELKTNIAERASLLTEICTGLAEAIKAAPNGIPTGKLYALLIPHGCTKSQFDSIVDVLLRVGDIRRNGYVLLANPPAISIEWPYGMSEKFTGTLEQAKTHIITKSDAEREIKERRKDFPNFFTIDLLEVPIERYTGEEIFHGRIYCKK